MQLIKIVALSYYTFTQKSIKRFKSNIYFNNQYIFAFIMVSKNKYLYIHIFVSIVFFLISAFYGLLLRLEYVYPLSIKYSAFLQAHSHVTFLGWGFLSTISLISAIFLSDKILNSKIIKISYWIMVICLASLLFSFPLQGYKLFSILFLTVFLLTSYIYLAFIYKKIKKKIVLVLHI